MSATLYPDIVATIGQTPLIKINRIAAGLPVEQEERAKQPIIESIQAFLDDLARRFGLYATSQLSVRVSDIALIADAMARLRADPPTSLGGRDVVRMDDLEKGVDGLPPTDGLRFTLKDARVIIRPSGTEPKLKCYLQVVVPVTGDIDQARAKAQAELDAVRASVAEALDL
jgi:phosphomannomutase